MADLRSVFLNAVETMFSIFNEAVRSGTYNHDDDDGFGTIDPKSDNIRCIFDSFTQEDVNTLSFSDLIQPTDTKGLVPSVDIVNADMTTEGYCMLPAKLGGSNVRFEVVGFELDPMEIMYTLLLRKN